MKWIKKYYGYTIIILLTIAVIIITVNNIREKQYDKVISLVSTMIGCILFSLIEWQYQNKLRINIKTNFILHGLFIIVIYILPVVVSFFISVFSSNYYIGNIFKGLLVTFTYISVSRLSRWLDEAEATQNSEDENE
jgi:hypothetical protein